VPAVVASDPAAAADKLVLPGVGAFDHGMAGWRRSGLIPTLERRVLHEHTPILGICLGLQTVHTGERRGRRAGTRLAARPNGALPLDDTHQHGLNVPHMGWNTVKAARPGGWL
jgi:glutamine amidotransferase